MHPHAASLHNLDTIFIRVSRMQNYSREKMFCYNATWIIFRLSLWCHSGCVTLCGRTAHFHSEAAASRLLMNYYQ